MTRYKLVLTYLSGINSYPVFVDTLDEAREWQRDVRASGLPAHVTQVQIIETPLPESGDAEVAK